MYVGVVPSNAHGHCNSVPAKPAVACLPSRRTSPQAPALESLQPRHNVCHRLDPRPSPSNDLSACSPGVLLRPVRWSTPSRPLSHADHSSSNKSAPPSPKPSTRSSPIRTWYFRFRTFQRTQVRTGANKVRTVATSTPRPSSGTSATRMPTGGTSKTAATTANPFTRTTISRARSRCTTTITSRRVGEACCFAPLWWLCLGCVGL